jgi:predicted porin
MKNVSKLALFVAAGMLSAGANANTIVLGEEGTSLSLSGGFSAEYVSQDTVSSTSTKDENNDDIAGEATLGVEAVRSFENFDGYVEVGFSFATLDDGASLSEDGAVAGLEGDFGQIEAGNSDSVYEDLITDSLDFFEQADLDKAKKGPDEKSMLTYYSPSVNGFSVNLQAAIQDEQEKEDTRRDSNEAFQASAAYDFGPGAIHFGYNDRGFNSNSSDEVIGLAATFDLGNSAEVAIKHEMQTEAGADTDFTGLGVSVNYGFGNIYGAYQSVSPDTSSADKSQFAVGIDTEVEDGFKIYAELANFDGQSADDGDDLMAIGLDYSF